MHSVVRNIILIFAICVISAGEHTGFAQRTNTSPTTKVGDSLDSYFPDHVGKFQLEKSNLTDEESQMMKRLWNVLFNATAFSRAIYLMPDPNVQTISEAVENAVLLTVASFPSARKADSAVGSLREILRGRGYSTESNQLRGPGRRSSAATMAVNESADDWAVIWRNGSIVFQAQSSKNKETALDFAQHFPY